MKKAVLLIAALVVFGGFAFGQASVGAWGRGIFTVNGGGDDIMMDTQASWGGAPRIGITVSGTSDNVGFQVDILGDGGDIGAGDQQKIWVKPIDMVTISMGKIFDDTLRGNAVFGAWNWLRYGGMDGEDAIFPRVGQSGGGPQANFEIAIAPVDGAYIYLATQHLLAANVTALEAASVGQYGAGYTLEGIGQIRVQYVGENNFRNFNLADTSGSGYINGAFKLTMIEGLTVDLGAFYWMECPDQTLNQFKVALYASYAMDALTIHVYGDILMYDADAHAGDDLAFTGALGIDYSLEGGIGINADFRYKNDIAAGNNDGTISGMVGVTKGFSNGLIGIGIEITTGNFAGPDYGDLVAKKDPSDMVFAVPIRLEYWF